MVSWWTMARPGSLIVLITELGWAGSCTRTYIQHSCGALEHHHHHTHTNQAQIENLGFN